jgi:hypothetical protein
VPNADRHAYCLIHPDWLLVAGHPKFSFIAVCANEGESNRSLRLFLASGLPIMVHVMLQHDCTIHDVAPGGVYSGHAGTKDEYCPGITVRRYRDQCSNEAQALH